MTRWKAATIHFAISLCVAALVGALIYFVWYPQPYFRLAGGSSLMLLIMSVDIVIGPLLTLVVFKAGKKSLRFDLAVISLLQICAFGYGLSVIAAARPVFVVAVVDRFVVVTATQIDPQDFAQGSAPEFREASWTGPRVVAARLPTAPDEQARMAISGTQGRDIDKFPKYYVAYATVSRSIAAKGQPLERLQAKSVEAAVQVREFVAAHGNDASQWIYVPLKGRLESFAMVLSKSTGEPLGSLPIDPW